MDRKPPAQHSRARQKVLEDGATLSRLLPTMVVAYATVSGADGTVWLTVDREGRTSAGLAEAMRDAGFEAGDVVLVVRVGKRALGARAS